MEINCSFCRKKTTGTKRKKYCSNYCRTMAYYNKVKDFPKFKKKMSEYRKNHKAYSKKYYVEHKEKLITYSKKHYQKNKSRYLKLQKVKRKRLYQTNIPYVLEMRLRGRLRSAFKHYSKTGRIYKTKEYGINYEKIIKYLGPCPGNRTDYHIDHIIPLARFDFNDPKQVKLAFAPENHQWLTIEENCAKGKKLLSRESHIL